MENNIKEIILEVEGHEKYKVKVERIRYAKNIEHKEYYQVYQRIKVWKFKLWFPMQILNTEQELKKYLKDKIYDL